jgi:hypothetical protein
MQEFWFCSACSSMNRGDTARCYKCHALKAQATLATVAERQPGVVLTPGLDEEHREIAWALMSANRYISAWRLGYVAGALLIAFPILTLAMIAVLALVLLGGGGVGPVAARGQVAPGMAILFVALELAGSLCFLAMVATHSAFLALTSMNSPALGSGQPRFGPVRSFFWWVESYLWAWWGLQVFLIPVYLVLGVLLLFQLLATFGLILGVLIGLLCIYIVRWLLEALGGPIASIGKPKRLLQDLTLRLGVPGASDTRFVGLWGMSWAWARGIEFVVILSPVLVGLLLLAVFFYAWQAGLQLQPAPADQSAVFFVILFLLPIVLHMAADLFGYYTLGRATIEMSKRQRTREEWVIGGLKAKLLKRTAAEPYEAPGLSGPPAAGPAPQPAARPPVTVPSPVGAKPAYAGPILTELPPDDMTPDWSRPVFSTKSVPVEPQPQSWNQSPVIPTAQLGATPPAWARDDLPEEWRRSIRQTTPPPMAPFDRRLADQPRTPPVAPAGPETAPEDRPVIRPSAANVSRYRAPLPPPAPEPPAAEPPAAPEPDEPI